MISMENWATQAFEKLKKEAKQVVGQKEKAMAGAVMEAIQVFCQQEPEFAQAVVQGPSFFDCMKKVASGVGSSISDLDVYKKAVQFYVPGAQVKMLLTIDLVGEAVEPEEVPGDSHVAPLLGMTEEDGGSQENMEPEKATGKILTLDLDDLFSF